jgi:hypothetical protein
VSDIRWERTPDRRTWRASAGNLVLTASRLSSGQWAATVEGQGAAERSPEFSTRIAAQGWAERAGGAR